MTRRRARHPVGWLLLAGALWAAPPSAQVCGGTFQAVPTPNPHATVNALRSVAAATPSDAWALGSSGETPSLPLLLHWGGESWAPRTLPTVPTGTTFHVLGSTPDGDVWLGGEGPPPLVGMRGKPVMARARGGAFERVDEVTLPPQTEYPYWARGGTPAAIDGTSAQDVWVALEASGFGDATGTILPSVLHFDGTAWTETQLPRRSTIRSHPRGLDALAPDDVWVVGYGRSNATTFFGEVFHFDGTSWTYISTPLETTAQVFFVDVSASGPNDVWVVGYINYADPIYLHWDGTTWTVTSGPTDPAPARVAAFSPSDAWALPYVLHESSDLLHWNGTLWTRVPAPIAGASAVRRTALARVGPCDAWAVGHYVVDGQSRTLAERLVPAVATTGPAAPTSPLGLAVAPSVTRTRTTVRYTLPTDGRARLDVVDVLGRPVATLADGVYRSGTHTVVWEASGVSAGVYYLRIQAAGHVETRAVTVAR